MRGARAALAALGWAVLGVAATAGVTLSLLAALAAAPFARPFIASRVVAILDDAIAGRLELRSIEVLAQGGIELRGVEVFDPDGRLVLSVGRARVFADVTGLRSRAVGLSVELDAPSVLLEEEAGGLSIARAFAPSRPAREERRDDGGGGWTLHLSRVTVRGGDLWWVDEAGDTRLEAGALDVDGRGLVGPGRTRVDLRLRGHLVAPLAAPLALDLVGGTTGDAVRVQVLRAEVGGTSLEALGEGDLARRSGRVAVTRLGVTRELARALVAEAPRGDDLVAAGYLESDGTLLSAGVRVEPSSADGRGRADAAAVARVAAPAEAFGFDVALDRLDPARLVAEAPRGDVTLDARGALSGRSWRELRARLAATVKRSRLRGGEITRAEVLARAERGTLEVQRATVAAPGLALDGALRWREGGGVSGKVRGDASDLGAALSNAGALLARELPALRGRASVSAALSGTSAAPALSATLDAPLLRFGGVSLSAARLEASGSGPLDAPAARVEGTVGSVRSGASELARTVALRGAFAGEVGTVSATAALPGFQDPASLDARGRLGPGRRTLELSELAFAYPGARWTLAAPATLTFAGPSVDRLELVAAAQRIAVSGGLGRRGALDARAEGVRLDLTHLPAGILPADAGIRGVVDARVAAGGTLARPEASATFSVAEGAFRNLSGLAATGSARWDGRARRAGGSVSLSQRDGGTVDVAGELPVPLAGRPGEPVRASARVAGLRVAPLLAAARVEADAAGILSGEVAVEGTAGAPALRASASLAEGAYRDLDALGLTVEVEDAGERLRVVARASLEGAEVARLEAEAPLDVAELLVSPGPVLAALRTAPLEGSLAVRALDLALLSGRVGVPDGIAGLVAAESALAGTIAAPRATARVDVTAGAFAGYAGIGGHVELALRDAAVAASGRVALGGEEAATFEVSLGAPPERLVSSPGAVEAAPLRAEVVIPRLALERAATQELPLTGSLTARLAVSGTPRAPEVTIAATGSGIAVEGRPLGEARLDGRYARARAEARLELRPQAGGVLRAAATLERELGLGVAAAPIAEAPAEASAVAEALDLGFLAALAPGTVRSASGKLALDVRARGPLGRLSPRGTLSVEDARLAVAEYGEWSGIAVKAAVTDDVVELSRFEVRRGSGSLVARGALRGLRSERAALEAHVVAKGFTFVRAGMDFATVDARLDATGAYSANTLAMELTVPEGVVRLPRRTPRELQTLERRKDIVVGKPAARRRARTAAATATAAGAASAALPASARSPFTVAAHVVVPRNLFVKGDDPKVDVELKADVRYERVGDDDYAEGAVEVVRGTVEPIGGRTFEIQRGRVQFTGGPPSAAMLDVEARYTNPQAVVTVLLQGPVTQPEIQLSSQPPMEDSQIAMLIATGRTELEPGSGAVGTVTGAEAGKAALGALATQAFKDLVADKLPLDTVAIESGSFRAGTYLPGGKIFVGYTRRFDADPERGENVDEVRVEYQISPRWTLESRYGTARSGGSLVWSRDY